MKHLVNVISVYKALTGFRNIFSIDRLNNLLLF